MSYTCYLHEGISLLKRLSRSGFLLTRNTDLLASFVKKRYEVPLYSNHTLLYFQPNLVELSAKIVEGKQIKRLANDFYELSGIRSVSYLENLSRCDKIKSLMHPLISGPSIEDLDDAHEVITLLERDLLTDFTF